MSVDYRLGIATYGYRGGSGDGGGGDTIIVVDNVEPRLVNMSTIETQSELTSLQGSAEVSTITIEASIRVVDENVELGDIDVELQR